MSTNRLSNASALELYRVSLENAGIQPQIVQIMTELGFDSIKLTEGKQLLAQARAAFDNNKTEYDQSSEAYAVFSEKKLKLKTTYNLHRKKAKVIFRNDDVTCKKLELSGELAQTYMKWIEMVRKFYNVATSDKAIQDKLVRLKISPESLTTANNYINEVEAARAAYLKEKGESYDSTKMRDAAFAKIDDWMREFFAVAKIGLEDNLQLLESLGKKVKG